MLSQRLAAIGDGDNVQAMAIGPQARRNDGNAMPALGHGKQGMRSTAFIGDIRLQPGEAAGGVEVPAKDVAVV